MPPERWLILADDLTGAADTAIAFARRGWKASVGWGQSAGDDEVLAIDAETRGLAEPDLAAAQQLALLRAHRAGRGGIFKKIDSTLRGHPAAELQAILRKQGGIALVAPAFPGQGRTTLNGRVHLHGLPLEATPLWARDHSYPTADLRRIFARDGVPARHASLQTLHDGGLPALIAEALAEGGCAIVCDVLEERDLSLIVRAAMPHVARILWVGSAGLAHAIAGAEPRHEAAPPLPRVDGGILTVVGSMAETARAGAERLAGEPGLRAIALEPAMLLVGSDAWLDVRRSVQSALNAGEDVLITLAGQDVLDAGLSRRLGPLLAETRPGGLIATGGETALALLQARGVTSLAMVAEVEQGVPLGLAGNLPVITKAGAFGDDGTLGRCLAYLRRLRAMERPA